MKRILFALTILSGMALSSIAQTSSTSSSPKNIGKISIGLDAGLLIGDASTDFSTVIGGSLKFEYPTATNIYFTISAGYSAFLAKSRPQQYLGVQSFFGSVPVNADIKYNTTSTSGFVPLKAGIKYYTGAGLFLEGQLGIVFSRESSGGKAFVYSPGAGYTFANGFEACARYEGWSKEGSTSQLAGWTKGGSTSQIALRLAVRF